MSRSAATSGVELPSSTQVSADRIVIEYRSLEHLREQVMLLAGALDQNYAVSRLLGQPSAPRIPPHSEKFSALAEATSA